MRASPLLLLAAIFLAACTPPEAPEPTATQTPAPTATIAPIPTAIPPWLGMLYADNNHSGERDPDEQALSGFSVCVADDCAATDSGGHFEIPNSGGRESGFLVFTDPNRGKPGAMAQATKLESAEVIPAYNENGVSIQEQHLRDVRYSNKVQLTSGGPQEIGLVESVPLRNCPVDVSARGVYIFHTYSPLKGGHKGLDLEAAVGTHLFSPGKCRVDSLAIHADGGHFAYLDCGGTLIGLGHMDFSLNNYDTLSWYGIPKDELFDKHGSAKNGAPGHVSAHADILPGQDLHLYVACTGTCSRHPHVHISVRLGGALVDPMQYMACARP